MQPEATHPAVEYYLALYDASDIVCTTIIHGTKTYSNGGAVTENFFTPVSALISDAGVAKLTKRNADGWHIFCSMQPFVADAKNRTKSNVKEVRHVFIDCDVDGDKSLADVRAAVASGEVPPPTVIVQSSPGRFQIVWNVMKFSPAQCEAMNENLCIRFNSDAAATDIARVLRVPSFVNVKPKYAGTKPIATIIENNWSPIPYLASEFNIPISVLPMEGVHSEPDSDAVCRSIDLLEIAMDEAGVVYSHARIWEGSGGGWKFPLEECPWHDSHTDGRKSDAIAIVQPGGAMSFACLHAHCADKEWKDFRSHLETKAGKRLKFGNKPGSKSKSKNEGRTYGKQTAKQ
jgi:hypothetical protein